MVRLSRLVFILSALIAFDSAIAGTKKRAPKRPATHTTIDHTKAYKKRPDRGHHVNIKITPPEGRGRKRRVLVEVYNYTKTYISILDFWLYLYSDQGDEVEVHVVVDDLKAKWSDITWVKIPGKGTIPPITKVRIVKFQAYNKLAKRAKLKYYTDLIKK